MMEAAGLTKEVQAKLLRRAVGVIAHKLKATKTHITVVSDGDGKSHAERYESEDHMAQLRAAEALVRITGAEPSKDVNASAVKVIVDVKVPEWAKPPDVVVESFEHEVLDVEECGKSTASE